MAGHHFVGALQTMLADGIKSHHMAVAPTDEGQGVGNIFDADAYRVGMGDIEKLSAIGSDLRRHDIRGSSFSIFLIFVILFR